MVRRASAVLVALTLLGFGCDDHADHAPGGHAHPDGGADAAALPGEVFTPGMQRAGAGGLSLRLDGSEPPALTRTQHTWAFSVLAGEDPQAGCTVEVVPFMPDHGHGANTAPVVTALGEGRYQAAPIDLFMRGLWTVDFSLSCGDLRDEVRFSFWIED